MIPLTDAQMSRHQLGRTQGLSWKRLQALESALYTASKIMDSMRGLRQSSRTHEQSDEQCKIPSPEVLSWMFKGFGIVVSTL
jgi:hypothetical protein